MDPRIERMFKTPAFKLADTKQLGEELRTAAKDDDLASTRRLALELKDLYGAGVDQPDGDGVVPLNWAARSGSTDVARELVKVFGAKVNRNDPRGQTALHAATLTGNEEMVRLLAGECGADVNQVDANYQTPLFGAAAKGRCGVARVLVEEFKAEVGHMDCFRQTPLEVAQRFGHVEVAELLRSHSNDTPPRAQSGKKSWKDQAVELEATLMRLGHATPNYSTRGIKQ